MSKVQLHTLEMRSNHLNAEQTAVVAQVISKFGTYATQHTHMVSDSRINIAGLNKATVPVLAKAVAAVL